MDEDLGHLTPCAFSEEFERWQAAHAVGKAAVSDLTAVSYNIWFADSYFSERCNAVLDILRNTDADIIGLQEVRQESLDRILSEPWVRQSYWVSDSSGNTVRPYGVLLLSRLPSTRLRVHALPTFMCRTLLVADFDLNGQSLRVGVVHLESQEQNTFLREVQLKEIFPLLAGTDHAILMGDFNFGASWEENRSIDPSYKDLWNQLRPGEPGFTEDTYRNPMLYAKRRKHKTVRFDRILLRSSGPRLIPVSVDLLGISPISPEFSQVYPSDHFGLIGRLRIAKPQRAGSDD